MTLAGFASLATIMTSGTFALSTVPLRVASPFITVTVTPVMLSNGFKLEVESLISKDISYVTEQYTPARLKEADWLD